MKPKRERPLCVVYVSHKHLKKYLAYRDQDRSWHLWKSTPENIFSALADALPQKTQVVVLGTNKFFTQP